MKSSTVMWSVIVAIVVIVTAGAWYVTSSSSTTLQGISAITDSVRAGTTGSTSQDGVSGSVKASDNPVVSPLGSAAGGIVDVRSMTVAQVVAQLDGSTQFQALMANTNTSVSGSDTFTVFVPTDGAFSQARASLGGMSAAQKARLAQYHVVKGKIIDTDAMTAGGVQALSGDTLNFSFGTSKIPMVGNAIVITQFNCKNGVVYTVDNVLLPPKK